MLDIEAPSVDSARMRRAGRELLSLALMDSRNHTLRWIGAFEQALSTPELDVPQANDLSPPLWELGHLGWFQERWIARNVQRQRGARCDPSQARLPSILSDADRCFDPAEVSHAARWRVDLPELQATRQYLVDTLETTLELLEATPEDDDDALYFYRLALFHEDLRGELFAQMSQTLGFESGLLAAPAAVNARDALLFPATRWPLGCEPGGFVFDNEKWVHEVELPEFEIDAQPVSWQQFAQFVDRHPQRPRDVRQLVAAEIDLRVDRPEPVRVQLAKEIGVEPMRFEDACLVVRRARDHPQLDRRGACAQQSGCGFPKRGAGGHYVIHQR